MLLRRVSTLNQLTTLTAPRSLVISTITSNKHEALWRPSTGSDFDFGALLSRPSTLYKTDWSGMFRADYTDGG